MLARILLPVVVILVVLTSSGTPVLGTSENQQDSKISSTATTRRPISEHASLALLGVGLFVAATTLRRSRASKISG
jgi:hypothetical protein